MISHNSVKKLNNADYDPKDISTFNDPPLAQRPAGDIFVRRSLEALSIDPATSLATFRAGNETLSEPLKRISRDSCDNCVLKFLKPSEFADRTLTKINSSKLTTLLPTYIISRYKEINEMEPIVTHTQNTPVYYSSKQEKFIIPMDKSIFDEIDPSDITSKLSKDALKVFKILPKADKTHSFAVVGASLSEVKKAVHHSSKLMEELTSAYRDLFISYKSGERVIVFEYDVRTSDEDPDRSIKHGPSYTTAEISKVMTSRTVDYNFFQAVKIKDRLYLTDENGVVEKGAIISFKEELSIPKSEHEEKRTELIDNYYLLYRKSAYILIPYTNDDWDLIKTIDSKLQAFFKDLENALLSVKTEPKSLDNSLYNMAGSKLLALTNNGKK